MVSGYEAGKRLGDILVALGALLVLAPVIVGVAVAVGLTMGLPILFKQVRPGIHGRPFVFLKFRTMVQGESCDEDRLTPLGRWLRATSLDELPSLWNVLRGEMSIVGPRPLLMEYLPLYNARQARRNEVKPGITGWVQINGRNRLSWDDKFELDAWYVDNRCISLDLKILLRTVIAVLGRQGISAEGHATMPKFTGPAAR